MNPFPVAFFPMRLARLGEISKLQVTPVLESLVGVETKERDQRQYDGGVNPVNHDGLESTVAQLPAKKDLPGILDKHVAMAVSPTTVGLGRSSIL